MSSDFIHYQNVLQCAVTLTDQSLVPKVNKLRVLFEANPQVYVETPLHPEKLTGALYGLVESFFKNDEGHNVTVNGDRYRAMITNFFIPELNNHDVQELWFQQDGATCHTARATIDLLKDTFGDRLISRFGPVNWPPRSCDLTPLDYFLWGYVKSLVYSDEPQTLDHLEDNIRRVIADIRPQMLENVIENWTSRLDYIRASRGTKRKTHHPDEEPKPRLAGPIANMPLSRMENTTFAMPSIIDSHDMGLRTVFTVQTPKRKRLFNKRLFFTHKLVSRIRITDYGILRVRIIALSCNRILLAHLLE
ncbi:transposable element Tc3 transposase [Trichonephila clavipes]|nr:transposable element Tc3 transposase [Trichonephila clavipes]